MARPEFVKGHLYHIKSYVIGKGSVPTKVYHEYIVRYIGRDRISITCGHEIEILATNRANDNDSNYNYLGIPKVIYPSFSQDYETVPYHRIIHTDDAKGKRANDGFDIRKFDMKDVPLCLGWCYYSQELLDYLKAA